MVGRLSGNSGDPDPLMVQVAPHPERWSQLRGSPTAQRYASVAEGIMRPPPKRGPKGNWGFESLRGYCVSIA